MVKKIILGSDHAGLEYKKYISEYLKNNGYEVFDVGTHTVESCDYPIFAKEVANNVASGEFERGILICGTGIGMSIVANKVKGIRAALCADVFSAQATRAHNDSNILCLGARVINPELALKIVDVWLNTDFEGGRHQKRIDMYE